VSGADPIDTRPGFAAMLKRIEGNGVKSIIVETATRFARDLTVQLTGHDYLGARRDPDPDNGARFLHRYVTAGGKSRAPCRRCSGERTPVRAGPMSRAPGHGISP
jgi:hypothetical protein